MAYRFHDDTFLDQATPGAKVALPDAAAPSLTALEWSVVALARGDRLSSLWKPGRIAVAMGGLFGARHNPRLACPRLEALRRVALFAWRRGGDIPMQEAEAFMDAGFTATQLTLVLSSIARAASGPGMRRGTRQRI